MLPNAKEKYVWNAAREASESAAFRRESAPGISKGWKKKILQKSGQILEIWETSMRPVAKSLCSLFDFTHHSINVILSYFKKVNWHNRIDLGTRTQTEITSA